ncbi:TonB-dependent receptor [Gluconobacter oxydans]|nr:TonB-dependent receptor [Gluconobacter oxydans]
MVKIVRSPYMKKTARSGLLSLLVGTSVYAHAAQSAPQPGPTTEIPRKKMAPKPVHGSAAKSSNAIKNEVISVRGQRQQYVGKIPAKDLPQNIQTITGATLEKAGIVKLADALDLVSGVSRQNSYGGLWDSFAVRGFAGDINVPSGYLVNGFNYGRGFGGPVDVSGIERMDVLKGPTSALFGRGEPGGTVNIITKKPQFVPQGSLMFQGGSYNNFRPEADYTTPLTHNFAVRINGAFEDADSFRDTVHTRKYAVTPSFLWQITNNTSASYQFSWKHQEIPFDRGVVALNGRLGAIPNSRFLGEPADGPTKTNDLGHQFQLQHDFNKKWSALFGVGYRTTSLVGYSESPELTAARQPFFVDGRTLSRQRRYTDFHTTDLVLRGEVSGEFSTFGFVHHLLVGADYDDFTYNNYQERFRPPTLASQPTYAQLNAIDIYNPIYSSADGVPATNSVTTNQYEQDKTWGTYLQDHVDITRQIKIRFGGRYDNFEQSIYSRSSQVTGRQHPNAFSPQVGIVYEPIRTVSLYFSYGKGFRANTGSSYYGVPFAPERSKSYEFGAKYTSSDKRVTASVAFFQMYKNNILSADPVNSGYSLAIGTAESKGVEVDVNAYLPYKFRIMADYAYVDAFSTSSTLDPDFGRVVAAGDPLINVPKNSGNVLLFKDFTVFGKNASFGAGVNYVGRRLGQTGTSFYLPSYTLLRFLGSVNVTKSIVVSGEINNVTGKQYYANSYAALWVYPGSPRMFFLRARYKF